MNIDYATFSLRTYTYLIFHYYYSRIINVVSYESPKKIYITLTIPITMLSKPGRSE